MNNLLYDKVINAVLYKYPKSAITSTGISLPDIINQALKTTDETTFATLLSTPVLVGEQLPQNSVRLCDAIYIIKCWDMQLKPNMHLQFSSVQGGVSWDCTLTITNFAQQVNIRDYCYMEVTFGYRYATINEVTGVGDHLVTINSPIFTSYQESPNPDGVTIFKGVIVGSLFDSFTDAPVNVKLYPVKTKEVDDEGKEIIKETCEISATRFVTMLAQAASDNLIYNPVTKKIDPYTRDPNEPIPIKEIPTDKKDTVKQRVLEAIVHLPAVLDPVVMIKREADEDDYPIDIISLSSMSSPNYLTLIKNAGLVIQKQFKEKYGRMAALIIYDDKLILEVEGADGSNVLDSCIPIQHVYSASFAASLLTLKAPFNPSVRPGEYIRVRPWYYNGADAPNSLGSLTDAAEVKYIGTGEYVYNVLLMNVSFGTYEENTMELTCLPSDWAGVGTEKTATRISYNTWISEQREKWLGLDITHMVYGLKDAGGNVDISNLWGNTVATANYSSFALYQVQPGDTLSDIIKEDHSSPTGKNGSLFASWKGKIWHAYSDINAGLITPMTSPDGTWKYISDVDDNGDISFSIIPQGGDASVPDINLVNFWPLVITFTNSIDDGQLPLAIVKGADDPDTLTAGYWLGLPSLDTSTIYMTEPANKEIYRLCGNWARGKWAKNKGPYSADDVADLYNIYLCLGGDPSMISEVYNG